MTKFCKDCKYFIQRFRSPPSCIKAIVGVDVVYGNEEWRECSNERLDHNPCGPDGKNFEPKKPLTPPPTTEKIKTRSYEWFKTFWK